MRQKELRIALVCYGGVSLAVYMHGVTKEIWKLARASRAFHADEKPLGPVERAYLDLLQDIEQNHQLRIRMLPDILTGASAGGINAVFLAQAVYSGQSLEPLTALWLENADVEKLLDPEARPWSRANKAWALPLAWWMLRRPGNLVSESVAAETREEVRRKVSMLIRSRWFQAPFSGSGFSRLLYDALDTMGQADTGPPLLPPGHPLDLLVTATDFRGHRELLRLNSPPVVEESEHRMPISFRALTPPTASGDLAHRCELTMAARATASFPGAFPALRLSEIDNLCGDADAGWANRAAFLERIMPGHVAAGNEENVSLVDGSVLVNAPFAGAMEALSARPSQREVDRRFVYIDPRPNRGSALHREQERPVGFFSAILGSLSTIPREQPIRDTLEALAHQSREAEALRQMVTALRPEVEGAVEKLFGRTLFLDRPTPKRLAAWRARAQQAAAENAGYAFHSYAQAKLTGIIDRLADLVLAAAPTKVLPDVIAIRAALRAEINRRGLATLSASSGGASPEAVAFLRAHDLSFRVRRLRLLARRLSREWDADPDLADEGVEEAREAVYRALALYNARENVDVLGADFAALAARVLDEPGAVLDALAVRRLLPEVDAEAEGLLAQALERMEKPLRRRVQLTYLGFPFYDVATLPLLRDEGLAEFNPVKVDRISPEDATTIRAGGTSATLRGTEFFNFGGFFSRAYRENDYLWGRLHGAERMIDLVVSTVPDGMPADAVIAAKRATFLAICEEEEGLRVCSKGMITRLREEIIAKLG